MAEQDTDKSTKGYGKHSKMYWIIVYLVVAVIVYGIIYLIFMHKGSAGKGISY